MIKYLLQKEFLQIRRNAFLPRLIIMFPIMIMCVMPWVMNQEVKNIRVCVVDVDRTPQSQRIVHSIEQSRYFIFTGMKSTYAEAIADVEKSRTDVVLELRDGRALIAANAVNGTKGAMGASYLAQIVGVHQQVYSLPSPVGEGVWVKLLYNPHQNYKVFMIPALLAIVMMLMCGFLPALNVTKWTFILAKLIPYWVIALFIVTACLFLSWAVYGVTCQGPLWLVYVLAMLLALFFSSLGLIISNYSDTMQQAIFVIWFFVVILMLLSGLFTPTRSMPDWSYATTYVNPMHYFIDAVRTVFIRGGGLGSIVHQLLALVVFAVVMGSWAVVSYKKNS